MITRREFIKGCIALSTIPIISKSSMDINWSKFNDNIKGIVEIHYDWGKTPIVAWNDKIIGFAGEDIKVGDIIERDENGYFWRSK